MDSESITMETDDDESFDEEEDDEYEPKQEVWVQSSSGAKRYKPVHLNVSYQMDAGGSQVQQSKKSKGSDPSALAVLRRLSPELQHGYRILIDLMGDRCKSFAWPFMEKVDPVLLKLPDYYDKIKTPMWLTKIESKFENLEYNSISEFVADIRQIFENCYRYNGLKHVISRQASSLECHFEQKLSQLSKHVRDKTHFRWTLSPQTPEEDTATSSMFGRRVSQRVLENKSTMTPVADYMVKQLEREEEERRKQRIIERKAELERLNKRLLEWEKEELLVEPLATQLKSMWEIPAIGQFLKLCCENMFIQEFSIFELERALVLPQSSRLLARIFTNVLTSRYNRKRVSKKPPMPYEFWVDKLRKKLEIWYAFLNVESATRESVARHLYIPVRFFEVLGDANPLTGRQFHDLSIYERVWLLKGMCDHLFETDYDVWFGVDSSLIEDQRVVVLGEDDEKASYLYFPHFLTTDLRIYRQAQIKEEKTKKKKEKVEKAEKSPAKKPKKEPKTETPSQDSQVPKKRGRPRKNPEAGDSTPLKTPATSKAKDTGKETGKEETGKATLSQPPSGTKPGRGRPRKDGTTPVSALKKKPAKPTAIVTPTRRSSRRSGRLEKPEIEDHDGKEDDKEESTVKKEQCDRTLMADGTVASDGAVSATGAVGAGGTASTCVGSPGRTALEETDLDNKHLEAKSAENNEDISDGRTSGIGDSPCEREGNSPSEHVLCNGVMDVCEADASSRLHSDSNVDSTKDNASHPLKSDCDQTSSEAHISIDNASNIETHNENHDAIGNVSCSLNQNQSNNVMDVDHLNLSGAEVADMDQSCSSKLTGKEVEQSSVCSLDNINSSGQTKQSEDNEVECMMEVNEDSQDQDDNQDAVNQDAANQDAVNQDAATQDAINQDAANQVGTSGHAEISPKIEVEQPEIIAEMVPEEDATVEIKVEQDDDAKLEDAAKLLKQEEVEQEMVKRATTPPPQEEGEEEMNEKAPTPLSHDGEGEMVERAPTPPPQPLPGLLPPEGEFELVCDSVESFRALIEKFAQKEETIVKGRKTIVQPIKRSGRTTELHKTLIKLLEDFEPIEAKLQKVVHKAREVVYNDHEAYKKDPSPSKDAAVFWYQLHIKKPIPAVETSSAEVSSVEDDFSSSESSDSDKLSEEEDSDGDDTAEYDDTCSEYSASVAPSDVATGGEVNGEGLEARGEKIDLYSGVEIAGRHMRSSKRRRREQREVIKDRKKAKRSKIQIVKGAPLQGRYAQHQEVEETDETKLKKVHEELKENLKAGSTFQMTKNIIPGAVQKSFEPYKKSVLPSKKSMSSSTKEQSPTYHRDTSDKFIRILKRTAGSTEPASVAINTKPTRSSPREPTLKVPFLEKSKSVQDAADAAASDKKMKTETFSFTIDAKIWESLKDKPEERQKMIVQHVEKMKVASGVKKEPTQKVQNSRLAPWFSRNSNVSNSPSRSGDSSELPDQRVSVESASQARKVVGSTGLPKKTVSGLQETMPILDPVGTQMGTMLQNPSMPALAPTIPQKMVIGNPGSISLQQAHHQGIQQTGNQSTAIASAGNSVSTSVPRKQLYFLLPNGQLTRSDGTPVETKHSVSTNKTVLSPPQNQQQVIKTQLVGASVAPQQYMYVPYQVPDKVLTTGAIGNVRNVTVQGATPSLNQETIFSSIPSASGNIASRQIGHSTAAKTVQEQLQALHCQVVPPVGNVATENKQAQGTPLSLNNARISNPTAATGVAPPAGQQVQSTSLGQGNPKVGIVPTLQGGTFDAKGNVISINLPPVGSPPSQQQRSQQMQDVNTLVQNVAAQQAATAGTTDAQKTIVVPTNLKVNMNNKQYKILYVQKPGAPKPELCLQLCDAEGTTSGGAGTLQGAAPLVTMQQPIPAATAGRNMHLQMVPQGGNKIVMQAIGVPHQPKSVQNVAPLNPPAAQTVMIQNQVLPKSPVRAAQVAQNSLAASEVVHPAAGSNTSVVTMISTPIPPVRPLGHAVNTGTHAPIVGVQSQISSGSVVPSVQVAPVLNQVIAPQINQGTALDGSAGAVANQIVQLLNPGAIAPSVAPSIDSSLLQPLVSPTAQPTGPIASPMASPVVQQLVSPIAQPMVSPVRQAASVPSASGLVLPVPEPSMKQIVVQGMPQGN